METAQTEPCNWIPIKFKTHEVAITFLEYVIGSTRIGGIEFPIKVGGSYEISLYSNSKIIVRLLRDFNQTRRTNDRIR